jgi:hypothetical protein
MDFLNKMTGNKHEGEGSKPEAEKKEEHGGGFMDKLHGLAGGGKESEKNEDGLDKGESLHFLSLILPAAVRRPSWSNCLTTLPCLAVDYVQEKLLGKGDQSNESAVEQAKDEQISDFIRDRYKGATGKEFFVEDKKH